MAVSCVQHSFPLGHTLPEHATAKLGAVTAESAAQVGGGEGGGGDGGGGEGGGEGGGGEGGEGGGSN